MTYEPVRYEVWIADPDNPFEKESSGILDSEEEAREFLAREMRDRNFYLDQASVIMWPSGTVLSIRISFDWPDESE